MLAAGDEFGRTQLGNNNAYAQDNPVSWIDWASRDGALEDFTAALADFRARSPMPDPAWLAHADWRALDGQAMTPDRWATADGFELRLPDGAETLVLRIDRTARRVTMARATILESRP